MRGAPPRPAAPRRPRRPARLPARTGCASCCSRLARLGPRVPTSVPAQRRWDARPLSPLLLLLGVDAPARTGVSVPLAQEPELARADERDDENEDDRQSGRRSDLQL